MTKPLCEYIPIAHKASTGEPWLFTVKPKDPDKKPRTINGAITDTWRFTTASGDWSDEYKTLEEAKEALEQDLTK